MEVLSVVAVQVRCVCVCKGYKWGGGVRSEQKSVCMTICILTQFSHLGIVSTNGL